MYDKYREDVWGWLAHSRSRSGVKMLLNLIYRKRLLFGYYWKNQIDYSRIWKKRKGFGRDRSVYKKQLHEKQKIQLFYHIAREYQLKKFFKKIKGKRGILEDNFVGILESRILSILYRMGLVNSMKVGSQIITHHGIQIGGRRIRRYNYTLVPGQVIELSEEDCKRFQEARGDEKDLYGRSPIIDFFNNRKKEKKKKLPASYFPFHRDYTFSKWFYKSRYYKRSLLFYKKIRKPKSVSVRWIAPPKFRKHVPDYLEVSYPLRKVMLVYRPRASEVYFPFRTSLKEVAAYLAR
jgi:ribosomal protein S4